MGVPIKTLRPVCRNLPKVKSSSTNPLLESREWNHDRVRTPARWWRWCYTIAVWEGASHHCTEWESILTVAIQAIVMGLPQQPAGPLLAVCTRYWPSGFTVCLAALQSCFEPVIHFHLSRNVIIHLLPMMSLYLETAAMFDLSDSQDWFFLDPPMRPGA